MPLFFVSDDGESRSGVGPGQSQLLNSVLLNELAASLVKDSALTILHGFVESMYIGHKMLQIFSLQNRFQLLKTSKAQKKRLFLALGIRTTGIFFLFALWSFTLL